MKNRRIVVVALMLVATLCVGVGFALDNAVLNFTGNIKYDATFPVIWGTVTDPEGILSNITGTDTNTFSVDIATTSWTEGTTKTFAVTVKNASRYNVSQLTVSSPDVSALDGCYTVNVVPGGTTLPVNGTTSITISVTLNKYPVDVVTESFSFTVTAEQDQS